MHGNDVEQPIYEGSKGLGKKIIQEGRRMKKERKCKYCGNRKANTGKFCSRCGKPLYGENKIKRNGGIAVIIVLLLVIVIMLVVSIQANNEYTPAGDHIFEGDDINAKADEKETVNDDDKKEEPTGFTITGYKYSGEKGKGGYWIVKDSDTEKCGLIDPNGKIILAAEYDEMYFLTIKNAKDVAVKVNEKWGVYDFEGNEVLPVEYDNVQCENWATNLNSGDDMGDYYLAKKGNKKVIVSSEGKIVKTFDTKFPNERSVLAIGNCFLRVQKKESNSIDCGEIYNFSGEKVAANVMSAELISEDKYLISVLKTTDMDTSTSFQVINETGEILFSTEGYMDAKGVPFYAEELQSEVWIKLFSYDDRAGESDEKTYYLYNVQTEEMIDTPYYAIHSFDHGKVCAVREGCVDIYNSSGKLEKTIQSKGETWIGYDQNSSVLVLPQNDASYNICTADGELVTDESYQFYYYLDGCLILQDEEGKWGLMDNKGNIRVPFGDIEEINNSNNLSDMKYYSYKGEVMCSMSADEEYIYIETQNEDDNTLCLTVV